MAPSHRSSPIVCCSARVASCVALVALVAPIASTALALDSPPAGLPAWYETFEVRRSIEIPPGSRQGDAVLLRAGTSRATQADCRDVRVVLDHQVAVPLEIIEVGPGDTVLLRFEVLDPARLHHLYLGSSSAGRPRRPRRPPRGGLILEVRELPDGPCEDWKDTEARWKASARSLGFLAPRSISLGLPPLGRTAGWMARYSGFLRVERPGTHIFETVSEGASFALIDGKLVASWPGFHPVGGHGDPAERRKHSGEVTLAAGVHAVEYLVATRTGGPHLLAWAPPPEEDKAPEAGRRKTTPAPAGPIESRPSSARPIPPESFIRWLPVKLGPVETRDKPAADFDWKIDSDSGSDVERHDIAELRFRFAGDLEGRVAARIRWSFGDGQTAEGIEVSHVYLRHGTYEVKVEAETPSAGILEATRSVVVRHEGLEIRGLDALLEAYQTATMDYDLQTLPREHLAQLVWLRSQDDRWKDRLWPAVEAWYARGLSASSPAPEELEQLGLERAVALARLAVHRGTDMDRARALLHALAETAARPERRDEARAWTARVDALSGDAAVTDAAEKALSGIHAKPGTGDAVRRAGIFLAELRLRRGSEQEAREMLERADSGEGFRRIAGSRTLASGARSLSFDGFLREKKRDEAREELERWEWELPADLLTGTLQMARARLLLAEGLPDRALRELESIDRLEGAAQQRPRALLLAAEALAAKGDPAGAKRQLEKVMEDFPHRAESQEASRRLEQAAKP